MRCVVCAADSCQKESGQPKAIKILAVILTAR